MRDHRLDALQEELLNAGIAPQNVKRLIIELNDHLEDLRLDEIARGETDAAARNMARDRLGDLSMLANQMRQRDELKDWIYRYPAIARIYLPLVWFLLLPAAPLFAGLAKPAEAMRWGAALMMSAGLTALLFLSMQLAIALT